MATFAPYVTKFAGYRIDRGTLNVDLDYTVDGPRIEGENKIVLDRLELGERVDSPEALDLPLTLALAVLRDSAGVIDVDLPVRGDLSNPQFGYGALIGKALRQIIVKAVTAPFTFWRAWWAATRPTCARWLSRRVPPRWRTCSAASCSNWRRH